MAQMLATPFVNDPGLVFYGLLVAIEAMENSIQAHPAEFAQIYKEICDARMRMEIVHHRVQTFHHSFLAIGGSAA